MLFSLFSLIKTHAGFSNYVKAFLKIIFGCPTSSFGPLYERNLICSILIAPFYYRFLTRWSPGTSPGGWFLKPNKTQCDLPCKLPISNKTPQPSEVLNSKFLLTQKKYLKTISLEVCISNHLLDDKHDPRAWKKRRKSILIPSQISYKFSWSFNSNIPVSKLGLKVT